MYVVKDVILIWNLTKEKSKIYIILKQVINIIDFISVYPRMKKQLSKMALLYYDNNHFSLESKTFHK